MCISRRTNSSLCIAFLQNSLSRSFLSDESPSISFSIAMPFIVEQIVHFVAYRQSVNCFFHCFTVLSLVVRIHFFFLNCRIADLFTRWAVTFCHFSSRNKSRKKCDILKSLALASVNRTLVSKFNSSLLPYTTRQHKKKENNKKKGPTPGAF